MKGGGEGEASGGLNVLDCSLSKRPMVYWKEGSRQTQRGWLVSGKGTRGLFGFARDDVWEA